MKAFVFRSEETMGGVRRAVLDDVPAIARVHVESWRTTYKGIMPDSVLAGLTVEWRATMWQRILSNPEAATRVFVAEEANGEIVGFVSGGQPQEVVDGFDSELYAIYLLQNAQGRGYGRKLGTALAQCLYDEGYRTMLLWVVDENKTARRFYEMMGGELLPIEKVEVYGGKQIREIAYGWRDLSRFGGG